MGTNGNVLVTVSRAISQSGPDMDALIESTQTIAADVRKALARSHRRHVDGATRTHGRIRKDCALGRNNERTIPAIEANRAARRPADRTHRPHSRGQGHRRDGVTQGASGGLGFGLRHHARSTAGGTRWRELLVHKRTRIPAQAGGGGVPRNRRRSWHGALRHAVGTRT